MNKGNEALELYEQENTNLRNALTWCIDKLAPEQQVILGGMISGSIDNGGVTDDSASDRKQELDDVLALLKKIETLVTIEINRPEDQKISIFFWSRMEELMSAARELDANRQAPTMTLKDLQDEYEKQARRVMPRNQVKP